MLCLTPALHVPAKTRSKTIFNLNAPLFSSLPKHLPNCVIYVMLVLLLPSRLQVFCQVPSINSLASLKAQIISCQRRRDGGGGGGRWKVRNRTTLLTLRCCCLGRGERSSCCHWCWWFSTLKEFNTKVNVIDAADVLISTILTAHWRKQLLPLIDSCRQINADVENLTKTLKMLEWRFAVVAF